MSKAGKVNTIYGYLVVEWPTGSLTEASTEQLASALEGAPSIDKSDDEYADTTVYHDGDRYNGKTTVADLVTELKKNETIKADSTTLNVLNTDYTGFWVLYQAAMDRVDAIYPK